MGKGAHVPAWPIASIVFGYIIFGGPLPWLFYTLQDMPALVLICYRTIWGGVFCAIALFFIKDGWLQARHALGGKKDLLRTIQCGCLIASNWLIFVWAVAEGRTLETAVGYYISPLIFVVGGILFHREPVDRLITIGLVLATFGVATMLYSFNSFPWVALSLGATFGCYGILKKGSTIGPVPSLFAETVILSPFAVAWLIYIGEPTLASGSFTLISLLILSGFLTVFALSLFGYGVSRLDLTAVGLFQFIIPTFQIFNGVWIFGEPFDTARFLTFSLIWSGVGFYCVHLVRKQKQSAL